MGKDEDRSPKKTKINSTKAWKGIINTYKELLPEINRENIITLNEGNTPLIEAVNLCDKIGLASKLYFKFEGLNPTGSFKDRGMTVAISKAVQDGAKAVICASTGNTSAAAAAYSARANIKAVVLIPEGKIAKGKLVQALVHGAEVLQIEGNFDDALNIVKTIVNSLPLTLVNSINPYRLEGQKTAAFEVCDQLGCSPDYHILPVGNAGNITAYWRGYKQYKEIGLIDKLPKMVGFQASGAAPIVLGHPVEKPETVASAIRIGNPASWRYAVSARDESGGMIDTVTDEEILEAQYICASTEGIFCEPASASTVAGLIKFNKKGYFNKNSAIICTLTGNGLKDIDIVLNRTKEPIKIKSDLEAVQSYIGKLI
ncbi:threonine synthase [Candidatus Magnetoovum chiemensis]|nr:threonine synthase [Candidatus Magnetoovum chiemensis]